MLQRYLQNNTDVCFILNFQCILHNFAVMSLKILQMWIITYWLWNFLETRYQNGLGNGRRWDHFELTGCFPVHVRTPYFPKIINEHPVVSNYSYHNFLDHHNSLKLFNSIRYHISTHYCNFVNSQFWTFCQAQLQLSAQLKAELALFPLDPATHRPLWKFISEL